MMAQSYYVELRPAFTGEDPYAVTVTVDGSGDLVGDFTATMWNPDGTVADGTPTAAILDAEDRTVAVELPGQADPGEYSWEVRWDDEGDLVVAHGIVHVSKSGGRV